MIRVVVVALLVLACVAVGYNQTQQTPEIAAVTVSADKLISLLVSFLGALSGGIALWKGRIHPMHDKLVDIEQLLRKIEERDRQKQFPE